MPASAPRPASPGPVQIGVVCPNQAAVRRDAAFPREAMRQGLDKGDALVQFTLGSGGEVKDIKTLRASHPIFARSSMRVVAEYRCIGQGRDIVVQVPFEYRLD
nr:energy transducer TonB [Schlegelella koreensis]